MKSQKTKGLTTEYKVLRRIEETVEQRCLLMDGDHIVIGLSGGPDSVCLFHALTQLSISCRQAGGEGYKIHPVHINHKFRPGAAERDQQYAERLCCEMARDSKYKDIVFPCRSFTVDCNALARQLHMTSEEAGRKARYDAFFQVAEELALISEEKKDEAKTGKKSVKGVKIAVAQNANDQAETVLFRILRGAGTDGLSGIAHRRREHRGKLSFDVIRPLLDVWREDIELYCSEAELDPVTDHTNNEAIYARNKLRLELLPMLKDQYNDNIHQTLVRLSANAAADKDFLWQEADKAYERIVLDAGVFDREKLAETHEAIRHRVLMKAFAEAGLDRDISAERLVAADRIIMKKQGPKSVEFPQGYRLTVARGKVVIAKQEMME